MKQIPLADAEKPVKTQREYVRERLGDIKLQRELKRRGRRPTRIAAGAPPAVQSKLELQ